MKHLSQTLTRPLVLLAMGILALPVMASAETLAYVDYQDDPSCQEYTQTQNAFNAYNTQSSATTLDSSAVPSLAARAASRAALGRSYDPRRREKQHEQPN